MVQARLQVEAQVAMRGEQRSVAQPIWLTADAEAGLAALSLVVDAAAELAPGCVVGSRMVLWQWSNDELQRLSDLLARADGLLVFIEPTAGLPARHFAQRLARRWLTDRRGYNYGRDIPADLRSTGLVVTTQVRLRDRILGDYVRGEARHFDDVSAVGRNSVSERSERY